MAVIFPDSDLHIYDYNRVVKDLNGMTKEEFISKAYTSFSYRNRKSSFSPRQSMLLHMYLDKTWYRLSAKESILSDHIIKGLDVSILQDHVLAPCWASRIRRTDERIDFVGGIPDWKSFPAGSTRIWPWPFHSIPSPWKICLVADRNEIMPPKSHLV